MDDDGVPERNQEKYLDTFDGKEDIVIRNTPGMPPFYNNMERN